MNAFAKGVLFAVPDKYLEQRGLNSYNAAYFAPSGLMVLYAFYPRLHRGL